MTNPKDYRTQEDYAVMQLKIANLHARTQEKYFELGLLRQLKELSEEIDQIHAQPDYEGGLTLSELWGLRNGIYEVKKEIEKLPVVGKAAQKFSFPWEDELHQFLLQESQETEKRKDFSFS